MTAIVYEIPLTPVPQRFLMTLVGVQYRLVVKYQDSNLPDAPGGWTLDIATQADVEVINGIPLVTGTDLLGQYAYLGLGFPLYVATDGDLDAVPTFTNLGAQSRLYFSADNAALA